MVHLWIVSYHSSKHWFKKCIDEQVSLESTYQIHCYVETVIIIYSPIEFIIIIVESVFTCNLMY